MEYDIFKIIVSVKDITDRGKPLTFVTCRVRFNHMVNTSLIPFRQGIQFALTVAELNKPLEFSFERDNKECGRLFIQIESQYLVSRFETEKWFEVESLDPSSRFAAKVHILIFKLANDTRDKTPKKSAKSAESRSADNSPRINYINNKLQEKSGKKSPPKPSSRPQEPEHNIISQSHPLTKSMSESIRASPQTTINSKAIRPSNYARILAKYPELKLNLSGTIQGLLNKTSNRSSTKLLEKTPEDESPPARPFSHQSSQSTTNLATYKKSGPDSKRESIKEAPHTHREVSRKKPNRKTKSLEKIKRPLVVNEYDRTHDEKDFSTMGYSQGTSDLILENQDNQINYYKKRCESLELEHNLRDNNQRQLKHQISEANKKLGQESDRFEGLIKHFEQTKENYETHYKRLNAQIDYYAKKCHDLERMLYQTQSENFNQKKDTELKELYEKEITTLREIIDEQKEMHFEIERNIEKKSSDSAKLIHELENEKERWRMENARLEETINLLKADNIKALKRNDALKLENTVLKGSIQKYEMQEEFVKELKMQRDNFLKEIEKLRVTNHYLLDLKNQHIKIEKDRFLSEQEEERLRALEFKQIQARINSVSNTVFENYENINQYLLNNNILKARLDDVVDILDIKDFSEEQEEESPLTRQLLIPEIDSLELQVDRNTEYVHRMEQNTNMLEKIVLGNPVLRPDEADSFEKPHTRPDSKSSGSRNEALVRSFNLKTEKSMDSLHKHIYLPIKDDLVDNKLADFINSHRDSKRLAQLFKRRSYCVYLFGSKRVNVKYEHGKILVKFGTTYQPIEKFLIQNLELENRKSTTTESFKTGTTKRVKNPEYFA